MATRPPVLGPKRVTGASRVNPEAYGDRSAADHDQRGSAASRGYGPRWRAARMTVLQREPLCRPSLKLEGRTEAADTLDHWYPHCGLSWLFWRKELWVPMSQAWHNGAKQELERRGETALDAKALDLGVPVLSAIEPERIWEWREAFAEARKTGLWRPWGG